jgi:tRNA threonylcarbamoyladenosine biosynthesis protein TsaE
MKHYTYQSNSEEETKKFACNIASQLCIGDTIVLTGDLGSGKTKFTEGFLRFFNLENEISSPTFTIVNEYTKENINIYHFDVYRLEDSSEFYAIGGEEYFDNGICLIEWGEIIEDALPESYIHIVFKKDESNDNKRIIEITTIGNKYDNIKYI